MTLSDWQKQECCRILHCGASRRTAANHVGASLDEFERAFLDSEAFAAAVLKAEAAAELGHLVNVRSASRDEKHWRSSVWWLEQRARQREKEDEPVVGKLAELVDALCEILAAEVRETAVQRRVVERLLAFVGASPEERRPFAPSPALATPSEAPALAGDAPPPAATDPPADVAPPEPDSADPPRAAA